MPTPRKRCIEMLQNYHANPSKPSKLPFLLVLTKHTNQVPLHKNNGTNGDNTDLTSEKRHKTYTHFNINELKKKQKRAHDY